MRRVCPNLRKRLSGLVFLFCCVAWLFEPCSAAERTVTDTEGRQVRIPHRVERAVVLTATCIESIAVIGALPRVAGISRNILDNPVYPGLIPGLKEIPVVAATIRNIDIERLLAVKPDLVVAMGPEHPLGMDNKTAGMIERLGIPVLLMNLDSLEENYRSIELMGKVFAREERARELVSYMKRIVRQVTDKVSSIPTGEKVRALYTTGDKPTHVLAGSWRGQDIRIMAGGINVAADLPYFTTTVSFEQLNAWNPDVITITHAAKYGPSDLFANPQLKHISAVKNRRVYKHPYQIGGLYTPRVVLLLAWHTAKYYPHLRIDWALMTEGFLRKFYGVGYNGPKE